MEGPTSIPDDVYKGKLDLKFYKQIDKIICKYSKPMLSAFINHYTDWNKHFSLTSDLFIMVFLIRLAKMGIKEWLDIPVLHLYYEIMFLNAGIKKRVSIEDLTLLDRHQHKLIMMICTLGHYYVEKDYEIISDRDFRERSYIGIEKHRDELVRLYVTILDISKKIGIIDASREEFIEKSDPKKIIEIPDELISDICSGKTMKGTDCKSRGKFLFNKKFFCGIHIKNYRSP